MRVKLTPAFVAKAKAENPDRTLYWDTTLPGFALCVTESGAKSFVCQYRAGRRSRRIAIRGVLGLAAARKEAKAILGAVAKGGDPLEERRKADRASVNSLQSIADEYFKREGARLRTGEARSAVLKRLVFPRLGGWPIDEIRRSDIVRLLDRIEDENGPVQADACLAFIRRLFSWHASRSDDFRSPIVRGMSRTKPLERARKRVLTDDELRAIWQATEARGDAFGAFVRFALLTAVRRNEAARIRRSELSGGDWTIPASRYKTATDHVIPLSTAAKAVLASLPQIDGGEFIFTTDGRRPLGGIGRHKAILDAASGTSGWTLHDLRRTARSLMSRAGVQTDIAERCLGHTMATIRGTYDRHAYHAEKKQAFAALAALIERIVDPQENVVMLNKTEGM